MRLFKDDFPFEPNKLTKHYYIVIVVLVGLTYAASLFGQSSGVMLFVDGLKQCSKFNDTAIGIMFLIATLLSGVVQVHIGNKLDKIGERRFITYTCIAVVVLFCLISHSRKTLKAGNYALNFFLITSIFFSLRTVGQSCFNLTAGKLLAKWIKKRGTASIAITLIFTSIWCFARPAVYDIIRSYSWELALRYLAVFYCFLGTLFWLLYRDKTKEEIKKQDEWGMSLNEAKKTKLFWLITLSFSIATLCSTGAFFHLETMLFDSGKNEDSVKQVLGNTIYSTLFWLTLLGPISNKLSIKATLCCFLISVSLIAMGVIMLNTQFVELLLITGLGGMSATYIITTCTVWPKVFGTLHLGKITGQATQYILVFSGISPFCYAIVKSVSGSFQTMGYVMIILFFILAILILRDKSEIGS